MITHWRSWSTHITCKIIHPSMLEYAFYLHYGTNTIKLFDYKLLLKPRFSKNPPLKYFLRYIFRFIKFLRHTYIQMYKHISQPHFLDLLPGIFSYVNKLLICFIFVVFFKLVSILFDNFKTLKCWSSVKNLNVHLIE